MRLMIAANVRREIDEQVLFIANHSVANALAWEVRLQDAIARITESSVHTLDREASERVGYSVYKLLFERTYFVYYVLNQQDSLIEVVSFRHGARLPRDNEP